ncbi:hypothetical protein [Symbiobacterium terraclitae]|uniref:hypothetical protein n=1 Tax=Symbiobacterium terraclitae TaxID=557451 RepID=UPI0035B52B2C
MSVMDRDLASRHGHHHDHHLGEGHEHAHSHGPDGQEQPLDAALSQVVAQEVVAGHIEPLLSRLSYAFGEEFAACYKFRVWAEGVGGESHRILQELAEVAWQSSCRLISRIVELGGLPKPGDLGEYGLPDGTPYMPPDGSARAALLCALSEVQGGVRYYHELALWAMGKDPVTYGLVADLLRLKTEAETRIRRAIACA